MSELASISYYRRSRRTLNWANPEASDFGNLSAVNSHDIGCRRINPRQQLAMGMDGE